MRLLGSALGLVAAGCAGGQHVLDPAESGARGIAELWWLMFWVGTGVFTVVTALAVYAILKGRRPDPDAVAAHDRRAARWVGFGAGATALILFGFFFSSLSLARDQRDIEAPDALVVAVTGHQWWWEIRYLDGDGQEVLRTANEIRVPVGRSVRLDLHSRDVIHSLWIPNLGGKLDLVPGRTNRRWLRAERTGVFRGQCAEFCGMQHAKMALVVIVEPEEAFDAWMARQQQPARPSADPSARTGQEVFLRAPCGMCHAIRGTTAGGTAGPDLTHVASRASLAAGSLPNTLGHLGGWISDPQTIKPGNHMPRVELTGPELQALLDYLRSLE